MEKIESGPVLIYDDRCAFCRRWVRRLKRWDRDQRIRLLPLQDPAAERLTRRSRAQLQQAVHLVGPDGTVFAGAWAAREVLSYVPGGRLIAVLLKPGPVIWLAERVYRWIARTLGPVKDRSAPS
jgi:predicted DCC family thiol-disulfide oxidoreductase YuxK